MGSRARLANAATDTDQRDTENASHAGSFDRDTLTWAFAKLTEHALDDLFGQPGQRRRYACWLTDEAPLLIAAGAAEQGLVLIDLELGMDGQLSVVARPSPGEFILTARHRSFNVVLASAYEALAASPEQECVCIAHFDGDAELAARWASSLRHWLDKRPKPEDTSAAPPARLTH